MMAFHRLMSSPQASIIRRQCGESLIMLFKILITHNEGSVWALFFRDNPYLWPLNKHQKALVFILSNQWLYQMKHLLKH